MKNIVEALRKTPSRRMTLAEIESENLIPWARDGRTIRKAIAADRKGSNVLKAEITGTASQRRYLIRARDLINYLLTYGPVLMHTARKPKRKNYGNKKSRPVGESDQRTGTQKGPR